MALGGGDGGAKKKTAVEKRKEKDKLEEENNNINEEENLGEAAVLLCEGDATTPGNVTVCQDLTGFSTPIQECIYFMYLVFADDYDTMSPLEFFSYRFAIHALSI